jgi:uncharacterized protein (TIGR02588 family)
VSPRSNRAGASRTPAARAQTQPSTRPHTRSQAAPTRPVPLLEWLVAALGALLVAGAIGYLGYRALWRDTTPPDVTIEALAILELPSGYLVQFRARNRGGEAAARIVVEGELAGPGGALETGEATLEEIAPRSDREGGLFFKRDPRRFELRLRAKGYAKP